VPPRCLRFPDPRNVLAHRRAVRPSVAFYNKRGTCEQWIKEGKGAIKWTRLSCRTFAANAARLQLHALAYNLGNFLRTLARPEPVKDWSLMSLKDKLIKIGPPRPSVRVTRGAGSGRHLASVLQEGRENANIDAGLGFIWRISAECGLRARAGGKDPRRPGQRRSRARQSGSPRGGAGRGGIISLARDADHRGGMPWE
jgi:Transposase DDE domain group 1